ncbi:MAG: hypothetical protein IT563_15070 [Alphaproteobacteria bacterium]|nr:hypothetical protein [Alphaproteobacteria bacterium]
MRAREVARGPGGRVLVMDTITRATAEDAGAYVVSGSHGGETAASFAVGKGLAGAFFNDAGVGKEGAGISGLALLERHRIAAATVAHETARIGDAMDTWENGVISHVNTPARALGLEIGQQLRPRLLRLVGGDRGGLV